MEYVIWPRLIERDGLIKNAHYLGHFRVESTMNRIKAEYFCRSMEKDVINFIAR